MRWNTDKYQVDFFACDTPNCNRDLAAGNCAHVCHDHEKNHPDKETMLARNPRPDFILIEYTKSILDRVQGDPSS